MAAMLARDPRMPMAVVQKLSRVPEEMHLEVLSTKESVVTNKLVYLISHLVRPVPIYSEPSMIN